MGRLKLSLRWTHVSDLASFFAFHNIQFTYKIACFNWRQLFSLSVTNNIEIAILSNSRGFIIKLLVCIIVILGKHIFIISLLLLLKDYLSRPRKFFDISKQLNGDRNKQILSWYGDRAFPIAASSLPAFVRNAPPVPTSHFMAYRAGYLNKG